ncbi:MAG: hypothetical protein H0U43_05385 [Chthoniobacterales bacterium]|nr:hypothetical protein [Chthoniobacterales bacterium]
MVFSAVAVSAIVAERLWFNAVQPQVATQVAIEQVNGGAAQFRQLRLFESVADYADVILVVVIAAIGWMLMRRRCRHIRLPLLALLAGASLSGCVRSYDQPEYAEIDTSETGFLIPLEGDSRVQAKFQSEEYLRQLKIATKRVQITHRWSQEGRLLNSGAGFRPCG